MSKHQKKKRYRKIAVAVAAVAVVATPTVAMACMDGQGNGDNESYGRWKSMSYDHQWWTAKATSSPKPVAPASPSPAATSRPSSATSSPSASAAPSSSAAKAVLALVNAERGKAGCAALTVNAKLTKAAQDHSQDMAAHRTMSHTGSDGSTPGERITRAGYTWSTYGENVAYGYTTPERVMAGWMSSPGHKANILNCSFKEIGIGLAQPGNYWTQDFATAR